MSGFYFIFNVGQLLGQTLEVGQGQSQGKFFLVGLSDGDYLVGRSDGGRTEFLLRFRTAQITTLIMCYLQDLY